MKSLFITSAALALLTTAHLSTLSAAPQTNSIASLQNPASITSAVSRQSEITLAERICASYSQIKTVSCEIRKTTKGGGHTIRLLSRVHYKTPNHIHVDNVTPVKRTIIADGKKLYYYQEGMPRGFSRPISQLSELWLKSLHNIPGTALEHLMPLCGIDETELPSTEPETIRRGYEVKGIYVVLTADIKNRLTRIDFFKTPQMNSKTGEYIYSGWKEVIPNCWISTHYKAELFLPAEKVVKETRHIKNLTLNKDIPDRLFDHEIFMKNIEFTDIFKHTYE